MNFNAFLRQLQGKSPGMGSLLATPSETEISLLAILRPETLFQSITVSKDVQLADVSFWQEAIDFHTMRAAGLSGVIIRAGQRNWADSKFKVNWAKAKEAGLPRGSYWLYDSREDPKKQAELWWSLIKDDPGELVHVADLEEGYGGPYGTKAHMKEFILHFLALSGLPDSRFAIYTGYFWWLERIGDDMFFRRFALWLAWYGAMQFVKVPKPWHESELLLWQYTSSGDGAVYGVSSREIDLNYYCCNLEHFKARFGLSAPPPVGEPMIENAYYEVTASTLNIRSSPAVLTTNDIGDLHTGDVVHALEVRVIGTTIWHRIEPKVFRGGVWLNFATPGAENWCAEKVGTAAYMTAAENPVPPVGPARTHTVDVFSDGSIKVDGNPIP